MRPQGSGFSLRAGPVTRSQMKGHGLRSQRNWLRVLISSLSAVLFGAALYAQFPPLAQGPPQPARVAAPVDLTGIWVSSSPRTGSGGWSRRRRATTRACHSTLKASKVADTWDTSQDGMCEAYGVGGIMRMPGRLRISWQDDNTLKIETDAGQQTRLLRFGADRRARRAVRCRGIRWRNGSAEAAGTWIRSPVAATVQVRSGGGR